MTTGNTPGSTPRTTPALPPGLPPDPDLNRPGPLPARVDVAVVGAGLAGLVAARIVAASGCSVAVFDGGPVGGRARSHDRAGFRFNLGPRALYMGGPGQGVLDRLQIGRPGGPPWLSRAALLIDHDLVAAPTSPRAFMSSPSLSAKGKAQFGVFMGKLGARRVASLANVSTDEWLTGERLRPEVDRVVRGIIRLGTYCNDFDLLSADATVSALQASAKGVRYADHGWQVLVDQLADGLDVHRGKAQSVHADGAGAVVVLESGHSVSAHTVVVAVNSPDAAQSILGVELPAHGPATKARCLNIGATIDAATPVVIGVTEPLYLSMHCPPAQLLNDGRTEGSVVHVMRYLNRMEADAPSNPAAIKAELLDLALRCGLAPTSIVETEYLHSMTVTSAIPTAATGGMPGRISMNASGSPSILLAGDYVGASGMLADCSLVSGEAAALGAIARSKASNVSS